MFEKAIRQKIRFESPRGVLSVEDLWDIPLTGRASLDDMAIALNQQLQQTSKSFVTPVVNEMLQLQFDIVKHVIDTRIKERDEASTARDKANKKQQLLEILSRKQNAELESKTTAELTEMINSL